MAAYIPAHDSNINCVHAGPIRQLFLLSRKIELPPNQRRLVNKEGSRPLSTMDLLETDASRLRVDAYIDEMVSVIGHADRVLPLRDYCTGLLLPGDRKSVEPMAALTPPARTAAKHQALLDFVVNAPWSDEAVLAKVRQIVLPKIEALGAIEASIVDGTGFPKKGKLRSGSRGSIAVASASVTRNIPKAWWLAAWLASAVSIAKPRKLHLCGHEPLSPAERRNGIL